MKTIFDELNNELETTEERNPELENIPKETELKSKEKIGKNNTQGLVGPTKSVTYTKWEYQKKVTESELKQ